MPTATCPAVGHEAIVVITPPSLQTRHVSKCYVASTGYNTLQYNSTIAKVSFHAHYGLDLLLPRHCTVWHHELLLARIGLLVIITHCCAGAGHIHFIMEHYGCVARYCFMTLLECGQSDMGTAGNCETRVFRGLVYNAVLSEFEKCQSPVTNQAAT